MMRKYQQDANVIFYSELKANDKSEFITALAFSEKEQRSQIFQNLLIVDIDGFHALVNDLQTQNQLEFVIEIYSSLKSEDKLSFVTALEPLTKKQRLEIFQKFLSVDVNHFHALVNDLQTNNKSDLVDEASLALGIHFENGGDNPKEKSFEEQIAEAIAESLKLTEEQKAKAKAQEPLPDLSNWVNNVGVQKEKEKQEKVPSILRSNEEILAEIQQSFEDTISFSVIGEDNKKEKAVITKQGTTYGEIGISNHIKRIGNDPLDSTPLTAEQLRPNPLYFKLHAYYSDIDLTKEAGVKKFLSFPPFLYNSKNELFINPVVTKDGTTKELSELSKDEQATFRENRKSDGGEITTVQIYTNLLAKSIIASVNEALANKAKLEKINPPVIIETIVAEPVVAAETSVVVSADLVLKPIEREKQLEELAELEALVNFEEKQQPIVEPVKQQVQEVKPVALNSNMVFSVNNPNSIAQKQLKTKFDLTDEEMQYVTALSYFLIKPTPINAPDNRDQKAAVADLMDVLRQKKSAKELFANKNKLDLLEKLGLANAALTYVKKRDLQINEQPTKRWWLW